MVKILLCPICNQNNYLLIKEFVDGVKVGKCNNCGLMYTPVMDSVPENLFGDAKLEVLTTLYAPIIDGKVKHFRQENFLEYLKVISSYSKDKKLLDIGCAHGFFGMEAIKHGFEVSGIEPHPAMARFASENVGLKIFPGTFAKAVIPDEKWDIASFTDSMEYFPDPLNDLKILNSKFLSKNGIVFIKVPNGDYFLFRHWLKEKLGLHGGASEAFAPSKRVAHYNKTTLKLLLEKAGFQVLKVGYLEPVHSPIWLKYTGLWLEFEAPFKFQWKEVVSRKIIHLLGKMESLFIRMNHFSQGVYIVARKQ